jgi:uncharacterized protein (DUF1697 family)
MQQYVVLLRGINVGGKNKMPMAELKQCLEDLGYRDVRTYIQSGNVILRSEHDAATISRTIEAALPAQFNLDSSLIKVLTLSKDQLAHVVANKPTGFGEQPDIYYSDAIFLIGIDADAAMPVFSPREGVDMVWPGDGVIYSQRLGAERTKSRLGKVIGTPVYQSMTIRSWNTTTKLLALMEEGDRDVISSLPR